MRGPQNPSNNNGGDNGGNDNGGNDNGGNDGGGDNGGGNDQPQVNVPPLPSTEVDPVDDVLTLAQAIVQCTLDGISQLLPQGVERLHQGLHDLIHSSLVE